MFCVLWKLIYALHTEVFSFQRQLYFTGRKEAIPHTKEASTIQPRLWWEWVGDDLWPIDGRTAWYSDICLRLWDVVCAYRLLMVPHVRPLRVHSSPSSTHDDPRQLNTRIATASIPRLFVADLQARRFGLHRVAYRFITESMPMQRVAVLCPRGSKVRASFAQTTVLATTHAGTGHTFEPIWTRRQRATKGSEEQLRSNQMRAYYI